MKGNISADDALSMLHDIRSSTGEMDTWGLPDDVIRSFCETDEKLTIAIAEGHSNHMKIKESSDSSMLMLEESILVDKLQDDIVNFYAPATVNPYVALSGKGPWIITSHGAVVHDNGGYGMLGAGHGPDSVISAMSENWVMANVMTPSFSHKRLSDALKAELGHTRGSCPFDKFICMNSGSESVKFR